MYESRKRCVKDGCEPLLWDNRGLAQSTKAYWKLENIDDLINQYNYVGLSLKLYFETKIFVRNYDLLNQNFDVTKVSIFQQSFDIIKIFILILTLILILHNFLLKFRFFRIFSIFY